MNPPCPVCGCCVTVRNGGGSYADGTKHVRYRCTASDCRVSWSDSPRLPQPSGLPCYYCGEPTIKAGFKHRANGDKIQRYRCLNKSCSRYFQQNKTFEGIDWYYWI